jgi:aminopeptidase
MTDLRNKRLAKILVDYSVGVKKGDKVVVTCNSAVGLPLVREVYKLLLLTGALPHLQLGDEQLDYFYYRHATRAQLIQKPEISLFLARWADKFINIVAESNPKELANIEPSKQTLRSKTTKEVKDIILTKKWVLTYYPTAGMAYASSMSLHELEEFYFQACLKNWQKEKEKMKKLKKILDDAKKLKIIGLQTELEMSLTGRKFAICAGEYNMPDGEVFGAPLETSLEGQIYFDFPSVYQGKEVKGVKLFFQKGRVVNFEARENSQFLAEILKVDAGARRIGELGIGTNFTINHFMQNILFDEKMGGTIHLALGSSFKEEEGGGKNESAIHWDIIKDMRKKGSKIFVDGKLIFKDGKIL